MQLDNIFMIEHLECILLPVYILHRPSGFHYSIFMIIEIDYSSLLSLDTSARLFLHSPYASRDTLFRNLPLQWGLHARINRQPVLNQNLFPYNRSRGCHHFWGRAHRRHAIEFLEENRLESLGFVYISTGIWSDQIADRRFSYQTQEDSIVHQADHNLTHFSW